MSLGRSTIPAEEMTSATVNGVRHRWDECPVFPKLSFALWQIDGPLACRIRTPLDRLVRFDEAVQVKLEVLPRHLRRNKPLDDRDRNHDVAIEGRTRNGVCLAILDLGVEVILPASGAKVVLAAHVVITLVDGPLHEVAAYFTKQAVESKILVNDKAVLRVEHLGSHRTD